MIRESWRDKGYRNIHWCNKGNFHRGHTNIILCGEKFKTFPLKLGAGQGFSLFVYLLNMDLEMLARTVRQLKKSEGNLNRKWSQSILNGRWYTFIHKRP